eukprot:435232_1
MEVLYSILERVHLSVPYVPGYLAFREAPHLLHLISRLREERPDLEPDITLVDGNGLLHPRGAGLACHIGVKAHMRTIGVAKTFLAVDGLSRSKVKQEARNHRQSLSSSVVNLRGKSGKVQGAAVCFNDSVASPIFVSIGNRVSLTTAVDVVKACSRFRIPEPIRQADIRSREALRNFMAVHNNVSTS